MVRHRPLSLVRFVASTKPNGPTDVEECVSRTYCGIDWSDDHHDVALVDHDGTVIGRRRIADDATGLAELLALLADAGDDPGDPIPVAIETGRGLLVASLRATGRPVYAVNPLTASRYRDRHGVSRKKSDRGDAEVLANILRTDAAAHRRLPADSELVRALQVLARAQQDAVWDRTQANNKLRALLKEYYPALLTAFADKDGGLCRPDARAVLAAAPTPATAAKLTKTQLRAALRKAGRQRGIDAEVDRVQRILRTPTLRQLPRIEDAMGRRALALVGQLDAACKAADDLAEAAEATFDEHPDAAIITSFPGLGRLAGARVLSEIGDDRTRFADARALKAYAGSAPITRASGKTEVVLTRRVKNQRLAAAGYVWAFSALRHSPGAKAHYDKRRAAGDRHAAAQRNLFNRMLGMLHHCLATGKHYDQAIAFPDSHAAAA
jgi:transposase